MNMDKKVLSFDQVSITRDWARRAFYRAREEDDPEQYYMAYMYQLIWNHLLRITRVIDSVPKHTPIEYQERHQKALEAEKQTIGVAHG